MFIHDSLNARERSDLPVVSTTCESLFVEINVPDHKNIIIAVIYRDPHTNIIDFNNYMSECLQTLSKEHKDIYIMGDFNINLLNYSNNNGVNDFVNVITILFAP